MKIRDVSIDILWSLRTRTEPNPKFNLEIPNTGSILECFFDFFFAEPFFLGYLPDSSFLIGYNNWYLILFNLSYTSQGILYIYVFTTKP